MGLERMEEFDKCVLLDAAPSCSRNIKPVRVKAAMSETCVQLK